MRAGEGAAELLGAAANSGSRCGGFLVVWLDDRPSLRPVAGDRHLAAGVPDAVLGGLAEAPALLSDALHLRAPRRPWDRVEVAVVPGARTEGEAVSLGAGCIRLSIGEESSPADAAAIARHEALHLLLAATLRGAEKWCDPELAFADWIVRGIEARSLPGIPRLRAPLPGLLDPLPATRQEVQGRLHTLAREPAARLFFGEDLFERLCEVTGAPDSVVQQRLWLVEAALGSYFLDAAGRLWTQDADALRPILLDDWLIDYEQYARGLANPPRGAGHLWRLWEAEWSRDVVVRLSVAAQALMRDDHCLFAEGSPPHDAVVWKNRGRVRLPLLSCEPGPRPPPLHGFRAVLRSADGADVARAVGAVESAGRGAETFEARALWPRILSRLLAEHFRWPDVSPAAVPVVQVIDEEAVAPWADAAGALRAVLGERAAWVPRVLPPQSMATLLRTAAPPVSVLLVHGGAPSPEALLATRELAARIPVRGSVFFGDLGGGAAYEQLPDLEGPLDPRYREETWTAGAVPAHVEDLPRLADEATRDGRLTTPLSHLLSITAVGLEECHYPRAPAAAPPAAPG
ncbi:MAG TPA: hypothetical protein VE755_10925 [Myxococcales bacterium]|nr:hypothetical protein [Myxococcales bacterium]